MNDCVSGSWCGKSADGAALQPPGMLRVGVSACLLGKEVRFDGGHKRCRFVTGVLAEHFEFVAFCPEVAIGMGTPRQPIRLVGDAQQIPGSRRARCRARRDHGIAEHTAGPWQTASMV